MGTDSASRQERATLAGGCFWCLQAVFQEVRGVKGVDAGYSGGHVANPSYEEVCGGMTGHAEVVHILFDSTLVSFRDLLEIFFSVHDPTTRNRQGPDVGTQYRSAIFYHTPEQRATAERTISDLDASGKWGRPLVTEVRPFTVFYPAEDYHQDYFRKNPESGYCRVVVAPKLAKGSEADSRNSVQPLAVPPSRRFAWRAFVPRQGGRCPFPAPTPPRG